MEVEYILTVLNENMVGYSVKFIFFGHRTNHVNKTPGRQQSHRVMARYHCATCIATGQDSNLRPPEPESK